MRDTDRTEGGNFAYVYGFIRLFLVIRVQNKGLSRTEIHYKTENRKNEIEEGISSGSCYTKVENKSDKGKPVERRRRKATGLPL